MRCRNEYLSSAQSKVGLPLRQGQQAKVLTMRVVTTALSVAPSPLPPPSPSGMPIGSKPRGATCHCYLIGRHATYSSSASEFDATVELGAFLMVWMSVAGLAKKGSLQKKLKNLSTSDRVPNRRTRMLYMFA
mmetsp:Transcript_83206/g.249292  ORF Transcript_83206/g.249292 Transcript_83206/m.249292 type:complete len:132 (+) Transcript_83206:146-541(+)